MELLLELIDRVGAKPEIMDIAETMQREGNQYTTYIMETKKVSHQDAQNAWMTVKLAQLQLTINEQDQKILTLEKKTIPKQQKKEVSIERLQTIINEQQKKIVNLEKFRSHIKDQETRIISLENKLKGKSK